jgi:hypothetical protein
MKRATTKEVRTWLLLIMARLPGNIIGDEHEAEAKVQMMAPGLANSYPQPAFTEASLNFVLADLQWFREADVRTRLDRWRKTYLPDLSTLPDAAAQAPLDDEGRNWVARWLRCDTDRHAVASLGLIRAYHQPAFAWLLQTDVRAASFAIRRGWRDPEANSFESLQAEWGDPRVVEAGVQSCLGNHMDGSYSNPTPHQVARDLNMLRWLVEKYAPNNLALVPSDAATALAEA